MLKDNKAQVRLLLEEYRKISEYDLEGAVNKHLHGELRNAYLYLIESARNVPRLFAYRLHDSLGTFSVKRVG